MRDEYRKSSQVYKTDLLEHDFPRYTNSELAQLHTDMLGGDKEAHEALWMHGVRMVVKIVSKMERLGQLQPYQNQDAIQEGNLAIGENLASWSSNRGRYSTFIWICIRAAIARYIESESRQGFTGEGAATLKVSGLDIQGTARLLTDVVEHGTPGPEKLVMDVADLESAMICSLTDKEQDVIERYYILDVNLDEQARERGVSFQATNKMHQTALRKLKDFFGVEG